MPRYPRAGNEALADVLQSIGANLRGERKKQSLTQHQLAELSGIAQGTISAIENGQSDIQVSTLLRFADALGIEISVLTDR